MRALVLGASGYVGGCVSSILAGAGHEVIGHVRRMPDRSDLWRAKLSGVIVGDLLQQSTWTEIAAARPEAVVHAVALNHKQSEESSAAALAVNVGTVWSALRALQPAGLKRWIYLSTQQVYGRIHPGERLDELRAPAPVNAYGLTHLQAELVGEQFQRTTGIRCVNLRLSNGCGAPAFPSADCWWLVVNDLCRSAVQHGTIRLSSDGSPQRDFIHMGDVGAAVDLLLRVPAEQLVHTTFNLGRGSTWTILELAQQVAAVFQHRTGRQVPVVLPEGAAPAPVNAPPRFQYDVGRLRALGFQPTRPLESAIDEVFDFLGLPRASA
jgi:UDP-glucose 4-epimerase